MLKVMESVLNNNQLESALEMIDEIKTVDDLMDVKGIGQKTVAKVKDAIAESSEEEVDTADEDEKEEPVSEVPYIKRHKGSIYVDLNSHIDKKNRYVSGKLYRYVKFIPITNNRYFKYDAVVISEDKKSKAKYRRFSNGNLATNKSYDLKASYIYTSLIEKAIQLIKEVN